MKLSIVIVNYNVEHFLEQTLKSVKKAAEGLQVETWLVDNNSSDGSLQMLNEKFSWVKVIANKQNQGFSKANNQAIKLAAGEYILLLNPDTLIPEDCLHKTLAFMDAHPDAGGLGIKMIDGKGVFLPESKRGLPKPAVAFYKIFGLSSLFPKSEKFSQYHLGYLDADKNHEVDILSGAFMLMRKKALDTVGLLDEDYFMYGEDVDLSYRLQLGGYKNYYFADSSIIHYKGESTKKSSVNYVFVFYRAMAIFVKKHFAKNNARFFSFFIHLAIYLRAASAIAVRFLKKMILPAADAAATLFCCYFLKIYWETHIKYIEGGHYPWFYMRLFVPLFILLWISGVYLNGGYDSKIRFARVIKGIASATVLILIVYALLPEYLRSSRTLILLDAVAAIICFCLIRLVLAWTKTEDYTFEDHTKKRILIIGNTAAENLNAILHRSTNTVEVVGYVGLHYNDSMLGTTADLAQLISVFKIDEIIFDASYITNKEIIHLMESNKNTSLDYKILPPDSNFIIGSNSIDAMGEMYYHTQFAINSTQAKRNKRLFDLCAAMALLLFAPLFLLIFKNSKIIYASILEVFSGRKTLIYYTASNRLPKLKAGIINYSDTFENNKLQIANTLKLLYAKDYNINMDLSALFRYLIKAKK